MFGKNSSEETEITEGLMIPSPSTQIRPANTPSFTGVCGSRRARSKEGNRRVSASACSTAGTTGRWRFVLTSEPKQRLTSNDLSTLCCFKLAADFSLPLAAAWLTRGLVSALISAALSLFSSALSCVAPDALHLRPFLDE